jgi:hypothetical protein
MNVRWVGFDMDECLGSFMPLWSFVELPKKVHVNTSEYIAAIAKRIGEKPLQLFRPRIPELVRKLKSAQQNGRIAGCFILTNNGSKELAETVRLALNHMAGTNLFRVAWHRYSPCRQRSENPRKDWDTIQACLRASGLPTMSHRSDLLYYDDQEHVLASEIPQYVLVPEYLVETPANLVYHTIKPVLQRFGISTETQQSMLGGALEEDGRIPTGDAPFPTKELDEFVGNAGIGGKRLHRTRRRRNLREKTRVRKRAKN